MLRMSSSLTACYLVALLSRYSVIPHTIVTLICFCLHSPTSLLPKWNLWPARGGITIHRRIKMPTLREHLHGHYRRQPIFIAHEIFQLPTQPSIIVFEIANVRAMILMKQDDNDTNWEISKNESDDLGASTLSSDIEEDNLDIQQDVLQLDLGQRGQTIRTTKVSGPKNRSPANTVIVRMSLPNLRHPAGAMAPTLLN
jgi:hypothetical protein